MRKKTLKHKKKKDRYSTWHTFQRVLKKTTTFIHIRTIYSYSYIYAYKTPKKNRGSWSLPGFPVAEADSECFFLGCEELCGREAVLAQGARPSQPGPLSRAAAQKHGRGEETLLNRCTVPELDPRGRASPPCSEASASVWACRHS